MKAKRKILAILLAVIIAAGAFAPVNLHASAEIRVTLHGEAVDFGSDSPTINYNRVYVPHWFIAGLVDNDSNLPDADMLPLRATLEPLGYILEWNSATRTANIRLAEATTEENNNATVALDNFMKYLIAGNATAATMMLTPEMQQVLPIELLIFGLHGRVLDYAVLESHKIDGLDVFVVAATHTKGKAVHTVAVDDTGAIAGFSILNFAFEPQMPAQNANFTAEAIVIGEGTAWPLDGLLTIPEGANAENPVPAVILVHGSGGHNMDSSIFENRPFADIAEYLSSNGIAVIRYNKRNWMHSHGAELAAVYGDNLTMREEYIEDVLLAAELLRADDRISYVFIAGHSLGGLVAPKIAEEGNLDGVIMLAASPHPLFVISYHQNHQAIGEAVAAGLMTQEEADDMLAYVGTLLEESRGKIQLPIEELAGELIFFMPALYQRSIYDSLPLPFITEGSRPTLIIHGGRDWQVTTEIDFQPMVDATEGLAHVTAMYFEGINHLLMRSQTPYNDLRDYHVPGRVDEGLLRAIVEWVLGQ